MTFIVKRGSFAKSTAGAPVSQTIDTLSGEDIKFLRVWTERQVGVGFLDEDVGHSEGWSDGVTEGCVSIGVEDNVGTADAARRQSDKLLSAVDHDQTLLYEGTITSFGTGIDAGKFTVNWTTNNIAADEIYYEAFCGTAIKNVKIGTFDSALVAGNQSITGIGFQPTYLNVWGISKPTAALPITDKDAMYLVGDAVSDSKRNSIAMYVDEGAVNTITTQVDLLSRALEFAGMGGGAQVLEDIDFVSFDADGWTHNLVVAKSQAIIYGYMAVEFEDVDVDIGDFLQETTNTTVNVPTSNENIHALKIRSQMRTATASLINDGIVKQMVASGVYQSGGLSQAVTGFFYDHNAANTDSENFGDKTRIAKMVSAQTTVDGDAELIAQTVLSDFRLTWANTDGTARELLYTAFSFDLQGNDFTVDAIVVDRLDNDFDVDALIETTDTDPFDLDAFLQKTDTDTSTVDAFVLETIDDASLVDAVLQATFDDASSVDAILVNRNTDASTVDAILNQETDLDFVVDANVQLATSDSYEVDALLREDGVEHDYTLDAFLEKTDIDTFDVDGIAVNRETDTSTVDAILVNRNTDTYLVDSILSSRLTDTYLVDGNVALISDDESLVDAFLLGEIDGDYTCDAIIKAGFSVVSGVDAFLRELDKEFNYTLDGLLELTREITFIADAILSSRIPIPYTLDAFLLVEDLEHTWTNDAVLPTGTQTDFTCDAVIIMIESIDYTLDAILNAANTTDFTVDAILSALFTFNVDANIRLTKNQAYTVDSILSQPTITAFTLDANIVEPQTDLNYTLDALLEAVQTTDFSVDANLTGLTVQAWTNDAIIVTRETFVYTLDALIQGPTDLLFEADAIITAPGFFFYTLDACPQATLDLGFLVDANIPEEKTLPYNLDAVVVSQPTFLYNLDAILGGPGLFFWSVDAILTLDKSCAFPDEDLDNAGGWVIPPLWSKLNSLQCDDVNFVKRNGHPDPADSFEVGLENLADPNTSTDQFITFSARTNKPNDHFQARAVLKQDGSIIIAETPYCPLTTIFQNFTFELTPAQADAITNYMTLSVEVQTETAKNFGTGFTGDAILV